MHSSQTHVLIAPLAQSPAVSPALVVFLGLVGVSIAIFWLLTSGLHLLDDPSPANLLLCIPLTAAGLHWRARDLPLPFYVVVAVINFNFLFYIAASWSTYELKLDVPLVGSLWFAIACGIAAFFRPVLVLIPALAIQWGKVQLSQEIPLGFTGSADYIIMPDLAVLAAIFMGLFAAYQLVFRRLQWSSRLSLDPAVFFSWCVIVLAGIHFSNYFYSGLGKLLLANATPLTWVLENPTYILAVHTLDSHYLTIQTLLDAGDPFFAALLWMIVPLNILVLVSQLVAVVILFWLRGSRANLSGSPANTTTMAPSSG